MSYFKNIFTTGAFGKTPDRVLKRITDEIIGTDPALVIELGAGKGEITENVLAKLQKTIPPYFAFEINKSFASQLRNKFHSITVLEADALNFDKLTDHQADLIICSLPLSFFPKEVRKAFLEKIKNNIKPGGKVIILFHAFWLLPEFKEVFPVYKLIRIFNMPPYYIIIYRPRL